MTLGAILGVAFCGYLAGIVGSIVAALRDVRDVHNDDAAVILFIMLWQLVKYGPLQLVKVAVALASAYMLSGFGFGLALIGTCAACAIAAYGVMRLLPPGKQQ